MNYRIYMHLQYLILHQLKAFQNYQRQNHHKIRILMQKCLRQWKRYLKGLQQYNNQSFYHEPMPWNNFQNLIWQLNHRLGFANSVILDLTDETPLKEEMSFKKRVGIDLMAWSSQNLSWLSILSKLDDRFCKFLANKKPMDVTAYFLSGKRVINLQDFKSFNPLEILPDFLLNSDSSSLMVLLDSYKLSNNFNLVSDERINFK